MYALSSDASNPWHSRISSALKERDRWAKEFKCNTLYEYYKGHQWTRRSDPIATYDPYVINLVYTTIKIKLAAVLFQRPSYIISAVAKTTWNQDIALVSAQVKQDTLNTIVKNPNVKFARNLKLAALDSFFRFGLVEVGYAADWRNPLKDDPYLKSWEDGSVPEEKDRVLDQNEVPINERFYIKRINAKRFLVPPSCETELADHDWCGYSQLYYTRTLQNTPGIKFPDTYASSEYSSDYTAAMVSSGGDKSETERRYIAEGSVCRCYHIFDMVAKKRRLLLDDGQFTELWSTDMERLPLIDLRWDLQLEGFYPIPPVFQWLSPQDEINETREQARSHRRRFVPKYQVLKGQAEVDEVEKFFSGSSGAAIEVKTDGAIKAIDPPSIPNSNPMELTASKDDFVTVSGTAAEARPGGDRETATKSQIEDQRARIRETADQLDFNEFGCYIGREILCQAQEKLVEGLWVKYSSNPEEQMLTDMQPNVPIFKYITAQDLSDGYDFTIDIDMTNATPTAMAAQEQSYIKFLELVTKFPFIAMSPALIRETAYRVGYKNEAIIHQMQQAAMLSMAAKASNAANAQGQTLGEAAAAVPNSAGADPNQLRSAQMQQPNVAQIQDQLTEQIQ